MEVEGCLFKVPKSTLETQSPAFRDMFAMPPPDNQPIDDSDENNPIEPKGENERGFRSLMKMLSSD